MRPSRLFQFFGIVLRPTPAVVTAGVVLIVFGIYLASVDPGNFDQTAGIALFLQAFASSTGYSDRATRGHFDAVLTGCQSRWTIARAHWALSVAPGLVTWSALAVVDLLGRPTHWPTTLSVSGAAALLWVSTAAWAVTLRLPRYAGGALWLVGIAALAAGHRLQPLRELFLAGDSTWSDAARAAGAALICPIFLVARPDLGHTRTLVLVTGAAIAAWTAGARFIYRFDAALVDPV